MTDHLVITRMGQRGDGIADTPDGPVAVPGALPGEEVLVERGAESAQLLAIEKASPNRVEPFCPLFGRCGGCASQHMGAALYEAWKRDMVAGALQRAGLQADVAPLVRAHGAGRRRVVFHVRGGASGPEVGFMAARSHALVPVETCPVLAPGLSGAAPAARAVARALASPKPLDIQVTATLAGLDVDVRGHGPVSPSRRAALVGAAERLDLARLSAQGDVIVERRPPLVAAGPARIHVPPGSFLQATEAGEQALAELVAGPLAQAKRIADLFCGVGPFALRLAAHASIHAVDGEAAAIAALRRAARDVPGLKPVSTDVRDLFRRPLLAPELAGFDAVVLDPPRAGAEAQARQLAASSVPVVVSVSCNAGTFARDAAVLVAGGYALERVTPVDQFLHAAHVEVVGVFRRSGTRKRPRRLFG